MKLKTFILLIELSNYFELKEFSIFRSLKFFLIAFLIGTLVTSCIVPFEINTEEEYGLLCIEGSIVKGKEIQSLVISRTTSLNYSEFIPVRGCMAVIIDNMNNQYSYVENPDGTYSLEIADELLEYNRQYKLQLTLPSGEDYESSFEPLIESPAIDSFYYNIEDKLDDLTGQPLKGIQFYTDLKASESSARFYLWRLEETYEFESVAPITYYIIPDPRNPRIGTVFVYLENIFEFFKCWMTSEVENFFLSNTINLTENEKKKIPLNYVSTEGDRLRIKYSLNLKQYSLSEGSYNYWLNAQLENGGLYFRQPATPITNIMNSADISLPVLGYFWIADMSESRIFVSRPAGLEISKRCDLVMFDENEHARAPYPRFVYVDDETGRHLTSSKFCMNCVLYGGYVKKPDFWE